MRATLSKKRIAEVMTDPYSATLMELLAVTYEMNAGTLELSGDDATGKPVFLLLLAVKDAAVRLAPEIERLTADEDDDAKESP